MWTTSQSRLISFQLTPPSQLTAEAIADMHIKHIFPLHGTPDKIISDCRPQFAAQMMKELYQQLRIKHAMSTSFHLQTNGQMEQTNKEVTKYLHMFCNEEQDDWAKILPIVEFAYNSHVHSASGSSPFELLYGYQPTWSTPAGG
jgi:transposase InsO family protein